MKYSILAALVLGKPFLIYGRAVDHALGNIFAQMSDECHQ